MAPISEASSLFSGLFVFFLLLSVILFIIHIVICVWAYRDCMKKGRSPEFALLVLIGLFFFPVMGLIVYLLIRNESSRGPYNRY
ncbi:PLDc N-terminal domain-containing protein [Cohnella lubricantis]|uniref:PLDc N-terminal domain-containing protein n=1 Tax=Cohnella lubricantis TaxID=2163172 RepID=A0A841TAW4_9BACL|nr:PLDc N-terminal domain-containing protein [Cohnella lubricantis]MBB6677179.1 PLDc N-terminal domain-containing protein [Cohnella lubricantis]MBP2117010.1 type IV secretory pathway TrbL component [Cohnella lubricantis]